MFNDYCGFDENGGTVLQIINEGSASGKSPEVVLNEIEATIHDWRCRQTRASEELSRKIIEDNENRLKGLKS